MQEFKGKSLLIYLVLTFCMALQGALALTLPGIPADVVLASPVGPNTPTTACKGLWKKFGYVCNHTKLIAFDTQQKQEAAASIENFKNLMLRIEGLRTTSKALMVSTLDGLLRVKEEILNNSEKCIEYKAQIRSNSLCPRCSGKYATFLLNTKSGGYKFYLSEDVCNAIISNCQAFLSQVIYLMNEIYPSVQRILGVFTSGKVKSGMSIADLDFMLQLNSSIHTILQKKDATEVQKAKNLICEMTTSITSPSFVAGIYNHFKPMFGSMPFPASSKADMPRSILVSDNNWRDLGQDADFVADLPRGDTTFAHHSASVSFANGCWANTGCKPDNLTVAMP